MRVRVKICGLTRPQDVVAACDSGADAVGLVFASGGPRSLCIEQGVQLARRVRPFTSVVALLLDSPEDLVEQVIREVRPALLQFHGSEDSAFCQRWGHPYVRAVPMAELTSAKDAEAWCASYPDASGFVFDGHRSGQPGGRGEVFDWQCVPRDLHAPVILAGGLNATNVATAVQQVRPYAVDVSSGVESAPGIKDKSAMKHFIKEIDDVQTDSDQR